jgi:phospholipase/carboxylesterase
MRNLLKYIYIAGCILMVQSCKGEKQDMETYHLMPADSLALTYLVKEPQVKSTTQKAIILLHGIGSNEKDLFGLAEQLPKDYYVICPRGKYTLSAGSYAWYEVDFSTGKPVYDQAQELHSREALLLFINQVREKYDIREVYLGGFSQGAIMSCSIGLLYPDKIKGVICLSGRILEEIRNNVKSSEDLRNLRIFLAHGTQDRTLTVAFAREAKGYLEQLSTILSYHEFEMGHQVNADVLRELNLWLTTQTN